MTMWLKSWCSFCLLFLSYIEATTSLVAGGTGFLGSHLCERLLKEGHTVICLDNLHTGGVKNIEPFLSNPHFRFVFWDITNPYTSEIPLDEIYNLACPASPQHYQKEAIHTLLTCVLGTYNLLQLATQHQALFFQASTSEVYGDPLEHPQKESYWGHVNPIGVRACYDEGKRAAEALCFDYHRFYKTRIRVGRIFNTYGPHMNLYDGRVISNFIRQALCNEPMTIYGTGIQTRAFCYVSDMIDAIIAFMHNKEIGPLNLGCPKEYTILEIAKTIQQMIPLSSSSIVFLPPLADDPKQRLPDISQTETHLHWKPKISLQQGLTQTIAYFEKQILKNREEELLQRD